MVYILHMLGMYILHVYITYTGHLKLIYNAMQLTQASLYKAL
ncbi:hypothetical protein AERO9A_300058 [Aeromonas salmonicida]|nr:hypothetical protein AERO9A_300058 [Aeromonas salmonicida]